MNIWRHPQRSIIMVLAIMAGLWGGIFAASISFGLINQRFETSIEQQISHVQIHHPEFLKDFNVKYNIEQWVELKQDLENDDKVIAFSGRSSVNGMLGTATLTTGVNMIGISPGMEAETTSLDENVIEGEYFDRDIRNPALLGKALADRVKARINSRIVLTFQDVDGELTSSSFRVTGIYQTANPGMDEQNVFVLRQDLVDYLGDDEIVNEVGILLTDHEEASEFSSVYQERYPGLEIRTWAEVSPELGYIVQMSTTMFMIILVIILLALAFGLLNTMLMSVFERIKELGMLMAIGMNKKRIFIMILLETSFLTLTGAVLGMLTGFSTILLLRESGIDLSALGGDSIREFGFETTVYPQLDGEFFIMLTILVILTAFFTAIYPALKALKLNPARAVQSE
ncbi:MAG: ABC transporter permease [Bacteroidales bacterium]